jgi:hypothetical protein
VLAARGCGAAGAGCVARLGNRRVGGFDILEGWQGQRAYLLLRFAPIHIMLGPPRAPAAVAVASGRLPPLAGTVSSASTLYLQLAAAAMAAAPTVQQAHVLTPDAAATLPVGRPALSAPLSGDEAASPQSTPLPRDALGPPASRPRGRPRGRTRTNPPPALATAASTVDSMQPTRVSARIAQKRARSRGGHRDTTELSDGEAEGGSEGGSEGAPSGECSGHAAVVEDPTPPPEGAAPAGGAAASAGGAEFEEGDAELRRTLLAIIDTLQAFPGCYLPGERLLDAAHAQCGAAVGRCASEVLRAMGGQSLRACGCTIRCLPLLLCDGGSVYGLRVDDAGALNAVRTAAEAEAAEVEAAAASAAPASNAAPASSPHQFEHPPAETQPPPLPPPPVPPADAAAPIAVDGQFLLSLRALLAHPDASALPGQLAARTRGGCHEVPLAALFLSGLRAAGMPIPPSSIAAAATGRGGDSDSDEVGGGGESDGGGFGAAARRRAPPAVAGRTVAAFGEALRRACGVAIARIVRPSAQLPVPGLLVPEGQPSVAAWLWLSAAQPRAPAAPCALDAAPASAPAGSSDH